MKTFNCYDAMIFSAGEIYKPCCDLNYYFLDTFSFKYFKSDIPKLTYNEAAIGCGPFIENSLLKDYYGICITREAANSRGPVDKEIEDIVLNRFEPIGIKIDSFYLPWNNLQFQMHRTHCFLVIGILNDDYICVDTFLSEDKVYIDKKTLIENIECFFYFKYDEKSKKEKNPRNLILFLKKYMSIEHKEHIEQIKEFAQDILYIEYDADQQINYNSIEQSKLIFSIANVEWSRNNFSNALKLASKDFGTPLFDNIIPIVDEISVMWGKVKSLLIKNIFANNYCNKASQIITKIADKENEVIELLLNLDVIK